jgi:hypothetical protein
MKLSELKSVVKEAVREAIQEELKDILLEAIKSPKQVVTEHAAYTPISVAPQVPSPLNPQAKADMRDAYRNILGETAASFNTSQLTKPLQITSTDTTSPNASLPSGEVDMSMIMGLMGGKV